MIALRVCPELFKREHAMEALKVADARLRSVLGVRSLAQDDPHYRPNYTPHEETRDDPLTAAGANYHQGPEWCWLLPVLASSLHHFGVVGGGTLWEEHLAGLRASLLGSIAPAGSSGLPELTNEGGRDCAASCTVQAWTAATLTEFIHDAFPE